MLYSEMLSHGLRLQLTLGKTVYPGWSIEEQKNHLCKLISVVFLLVTIFNSLWSKGSVCPQILMDLLAELVAS